MAKLHFDLVSPERLLISAEVDQVDVPGSEGGFGVFANHAPLMTTLKPGVLTIFNQGKPAEKFFVRGGFAEVTLQGLTVLAEEAMPMAELDGTLSQRIKDAEEDVTDAKDDATRHRAQGQLDGLRELRAALG
ncbi:MAG: F0F1 ATP synthase subunit epsilon [Alphaproteobacteria bacterium]|mgnify:CR=1 FL=1|nr:F0F1 ATP synthase subunit epsilon [Alphaproteobacteria bacterium]